MAIGFLLLCSGGMAQAQSCNFTASDIVINDVDLIGSSPTLGSGEIGITCFSLLNLVSSITITIRIGEGRGGLSGNLRRMTNPATATGLSYQLYKNSGRTEVFGGLPGAPGGTELVLSGSSLLDILSTTSMTVPIYARIPAGQNGVVPHASSDYSSAFDRNQTDVRVEVYTCTLFLCGTQVRTFSFNVIAKVLPDCMVEASDMSFGTHSLLAQNIDTTSVIDVSCTVGTPFNVNLGYGLNGTSAASRHMRNAGGNLINYQLFRNQQRTLPWGVLSHGLASPHSGSGANQELTVYGRVPPQPAPDPGTYSDTVVISVTY